MKKSIILAVLLAVAITTNAQDSYFNCATIELYCNGWVIGAHAQRGDTVKVSYNYQGETITKKFVCTGDFSKDHFAVPHDGLKRYDLIVLHVVMPGWKNDIFYQRIIKRDYILEMDNKSGEVIGWINVVDSSARERLIDFKEKCPVFYSKDKEDFVLLEWNKFITE